MSVSQKTITQDVSLTGVGLHTGAAVTVTLKPAPAGAGISFVRVDLPGQPVIKAMPENVFMDERLPRCTSIGFDETVIHTVEHLLCVLCGLGIDNLIIELNGSELPGLDGSGLEFLSAVKKAGTVEQEVPRHYFDVREPICITRGDSSICMFPAGELQIDYTLDYNHDALRSQFFSAVVTEETFCDEIAPSRTFCLEEEAKALQDSGLGKGANYQNTLVVGKKGIIDNKTRFDDEFARHKVVDIIGDLYLLGMSVRGHVVAVKSGHTLNLQLLKKLSEQQKKYDSAHGFGSYTGVGATKLGINDIMKILPHRYPFLLVDRVVELEQGKRAVAIKNVTVNEPFFQGHFPARPIMPGVMMVEAMAQTGGLAVLTSEKNKGNIALFMGANNVKFRKVVTPGDQLVFEAEVIRDKTRTAQMHGTVKVDGAVVAEADLLFSYADADYLK